MKILLAGYYGFDNLGDELLGETSQNILKPLARQIKVLNRSERKFFRVIELIKDCDLLVFGGGSLFQDVTGRGLTVLYYFFLFKLAKIFRKKVFFIAQGVGPIKRRVNLWLVKQCFQKADYVTVRNKESAAFLMALGVKKFKVYNDLLFAYSVPGVRPLKKDQKLSIVFCFKKQRKDYHQQLLKLMQRIRAVLKNVEITVVPMQKDYDESLIKNLNQIEGLKILPYDRQAIFQAIAGADLAVGMRMHFLILAAKFQVPFIGIVYDPKVTGICKGLNMPYIYLSDLDALGTMLLGEIPKIQVRRQQLKKHLGQEESVAKQAVMELVQVVKQCQ